MNEWLFFFGLVVLTVACLSYRHPYMHRLCLLCVAATSFAAGYLPTKSVWVGLFCVSVWLVLPWVEILVRVPKLRLPLRKQLRQVPPPAREMFPELHEMTSEIEAAGFEHVADLGWEMDGYRQFYRLFIHSERREEAFLSFVEHQRFGFHFIGVTSRGRDGAIFTTWNSPAASSLKTPPSVRLQRVSDDLMFPAVLEEHGNFLRRAGVTPDALCPVDPEGVRLAMERDAEAQMQHNLGEGLLHEAGDGQGRYSWRGMLFLWVQFWRDLFRVT